MSPEPDTNLVPHNKTHFTNIAFVLYFTVVIAITLVDIIHR